MCIYFAVRIRYAWVEVGCLYLCIVSGMHGWRWVICLCIVSGVRVEVGYLCDYCTYQVCTVGGGLFVFIVRIRCARVEVGCVYCIYQVCTGGGGLFVCVCVYCTYQVCTGGVGYLCVFIVCIRCAQVEVGYLCVCLLYVSDVHGGGGLFVCVYCTY